MEKLQLYKILSKPFNSEDWLDILHTVFGANRLFSQPIEIILPSNDRARTAYELGNFTTSDDRIIGLYRIELNPDVRLERNKVGLRKLLRNVYKYDVDGAIIVFHQGDNWRLSFVSEIRVLNDKQEVVEQITETRRYTYLLGKDKKVKTPSDRLSKLAGKTIALHDILNAFSVETLSKEFYDKLYKWYEKAQQQVTFPNDEQAENHIQTSLIRLLTRLLFIWFLKEKKLINADLFDKNKLPTLIDYQKDSSFYKAILQNLFFATLNSQITKRSFRRTTNGTANNTNYLVTNIYRYQNYFIRSDENDIMALFEEAPFLNGGLFECLDREASDAEKQDYDNDQTIRPVKSAIRIDGFSDGASNELVFDNRLFFNDDEQNLGLIDLFNQYQFTVEESTPLDIEVALDPELLGKVFENLLASYNPETGQQARKATGSFYTPREIVSYMVDESLKQYFKQHTDLDENQINHLFVDEIETENTLNSQQIKTIIHAIDNLKILDPAVGSGAYPMGILQRLVLILEKVDAGNIYFKQQQIYKAEKIPDKNSRNSAIDAIEQVFSQQNQHNVYGKKLYLIENCIYGVDIQPIAIQICKLRFFISLTIEQNPNRNKNDNYGIKALPNLETRFIVANSLLPLGEMPKQAEGLFDEKIIELQQQLAKIRHKYFSVKTLKTKRKYRKKDKALRQEMLAELTKSGITPAVEASMRKIVEWDLYNQNAIADWFNPLWQFGVIDGFDIVIGNPPYVTYGLDRRYSTILKAVNTRIQGVRNARNLFAYFIEKSITLLNDKGTLTFIVPHSISRVDGYQYIRKFINDNSTLWQIVDEYDQFNNVTLEMVTLFMSKNMDKPQYIKSLSNREGCKYKIPINIYQITGYYPIYYDIIYEKISQNKIKYIGGYRGFSNLNQDENGNTLYVGGKNIRPYNIEMGHKEYYISKQHFHPKLREKEIVITQFGASLRGTIIDTNKIIPSGGCVVITHDDNLLPKFVLSLINSLVVRYFFDRYIMNNASLTVHLDGHYLNKIPIPKISKQEQQPFIDLVDKILTAKQQAQDTTELETKIDQLVYNLYHLTDDEIKIIENKL